MQDFNDLPYLSCVFHHGRAIFDAFDGRSLQFLVIPNGSGPHKNSAALLLRRRSITSDNQGTIRSWLHSMDSTSPLVTPQD